MRILSALALLVGTVALSTAGAEEDPCRAAPAHLKQGGLDFYFRHGLWVRSDEGSLQLTSEEAFCRIDRRKDGRIRVTTSPTADDCSSELVATDYSTAELLGRLANNLGMSRLRQKDYAGATTAFRKATASDPKSDKAMTNLACALNRSGDTQAAVATLLGLAKRNLPLVLHKVATDPDLAGLTDDPRLAALRAAEAVTLDADNQFRDPKGRSQALAIQPEKRWLAVVDVTGSCCLDVSDASLLLVDAEGKQLTALPIGCRGADCDKKVDGRPLANRLLQELGFVLPSDAITVPLPAEDADAGASVKSRTRTRSQCEMGRGRRLFRADRRSPR